MSLLAYCRTYNAFFMECPPLCSIHLYWQIKVLIWWWCWNPIAFLHSRIVIVATLITERLFKHFFICTVWGWQQWCNLHTSQVSYRRMCRILRWNIFNLFHATTVQGVSCSHSIFHTTNALYGKVMLNSLLYD